MMLRPSKHAHPDQTVVNVATILLKWLRARRVEEYESLRKHAGKAVRGGDTLYVPSLDLLYLLGLVAYRPKTDSFEYVGPNEAV
jgi:hypothetical protein